MVIKENMQWPPMNYLSWKMVEHSAWYSGSAEILANYYTEYINKNLMQLPYTLNTNGDNFWGRQIRNQSETFVHVPIAGDIAETSANLLFGEQPIIKIAESTEKNASILYKDSQKELEEILKDIGFHRKLLESAEACAAIGGVYIKIAWDEELTKYPIPVIVQADKAVPEFKFGMLVAVTFWKIVDSDDSGSKVLRLLERYSKGKIEYSLYQGTSDKLGKNVSLETHEETKELMDVMPTIDELLAVYIPNALPNRIDRSSFLGRSDYLGIEPLMDSLDEIFSAWVTEIEIAKARILLPESYIEKQSIGKKFNIDRSVYVGLDIDPTVEGHSITAQQFLIRAEEYEKTSMNFMERIITSAGYSPQSFGINIAGRAESGTALAIRERKSFSTKAKKQSYWSDAISSIVHKIMLVYNAELSGKMETDINLTVSFSDSVSNDLTTTANALKMLSDAQSASIEVRVKILNPDWEEEQVENEVKRIKEENSIGSVASPDGVNLDMYQLDKKQGDNNANQDGSESNTDQPDQ